MVVECNTLSGLVASEPLSALMSDSLIPVGRNIWTVIIRYNAWKEGVGAGGLGFVDPNANGLAVHPLLPFRLMCCGMAL